LYNFSCFHITETLRRGRSSCPDAASHSTSPASLIKKILTPPSRLHHTMLPFARPTPPCRRGHPSPHAPHPTSSHVPSPATPYPPPCHVTSHVGLQFASPVAAMTFTGPPPPRCHQEEVITSPYISSPTAGRRGLRLRLDVH
jgi:hypothetical protein